jgi:hypothetical protein
LEREPGVSSAEVEAESERAQLKLSFKQPRKHPGRQELPAYLPCIEKIVACTPEQCVCGNCGKENRVIGFEKSEQLHGSSFSVSSCSCTWAGVGLGRIKPIEIRSAHIL